MLMQLFFSETDQKPQETILNAGSWFFDEKTSKNDKTHQRYFYSNYDTNLIPNTYIAISNEQVLLSRSSSAEIPLFFFITNNSLFVSDSVYELQQQVKQPLDDDAAYQYLYSQFLPKEKTLFKGVIQILNEQEISFKLNGTVIESSLNEKFALPSTEFDGKSEYELTQGLREQIIKVHADRLGESNALFLSGGLDSQAMAITLSKDLGLGNSLSSLHFSVKGARQSELEDAKLTAKTLGISFHATEVDPTKEVDFQKILQMNAPYIGAVSINQLLQDSELVEGSTIFAGQDHRLHTPSLRTLDDKIVNLYQYFGFGQLVSGASSTALAIKGMFSKEYESKLYRSLSLFSGTDSMQKYLANRFLHVARLPFQDKKVIGALQTTLAHELGEIKVSDKRTLFNAVANSVWRRKGIYDINYMHDTVSLSGNKVAMPFYDTQMAYYAAQLPFDLAAKETKGRAGHGVHEVSVNKYLLRKAYEGELDDSLVFRDKAVCLTSHMFFNAGLSKELESFIDASWLAEHETAQFLNLPELQALCKRKHKNWLESDHWLMMAVFNALVIYNHLRTLV